MIKIRITGTRDDIERVFAFLKTASFMDYEEIARKQFYPVRDDQNEESKTQYNFYADFVTESDLDLMRIVGGVLRDDQIIEYLRIYGSSDTAALLRFFDIEYEQLKEQLERMVNEEWLVRTLYGSNHRKEGRWVYSLGPKVTKGTKMDFCDYLYRYDVNAYRCKKFGRSLSSGFNIIPEDCEDCSFRSREVK